MYHRCMLIDAASLAPGSKVEPPDAYKLDQARRAYWRLSYRGGVDYRDGTDTDGQEMLIRFESETPEGYDRRRKTTTPRNYCGPILRRYNDFVFRREPVVPNEAGDWYDVFLDDCDGHGTTLKDFFRKLLLVGQVEREAYFLCDSSSGTQARSRLDAMVSGTRPVLRRVMADSVWAAEFAGKSVLAASVLMERDDGETVLRQYDATMRQDVVIRKDARSLQWIVVAVDEPTPHGYPVCPLMALRPTFDDLGSGATQSQCGPIADAQRAVFNLLGLISEELYQNTYTQWIFHGVRAEDIKDGTARMGAKRILCMPDPQSSTTRIGSDVAQADSLRKQLADEEANIYRMAGISAADPTQTQAPESGVARAFRFNDLAANLSALADAVEAVWNNAVWAQSQAWGLPYPGDVKMPDDFVPPDMGAEIIELVQAVSNRDLPPVLRQHMVRRFADRNLSLSEDEQIILDAQMPSVGVSPLTTPNGTPLALDGAGG